MGFLGPPLGVDGLARFTAFLMVAVGAGSTALVTDAGQIEIPREGSTIVHGYTPGRLLKASQM